MARKKEEKKYFDLSGEWTVTNVRDLDFGTFFTLQLPGLSLYNLRVVPAGKKYDAFIAVPEEKGKDGNWHKIYNLFLDPEDVADIIEEVKEIAQSKLK